MAHLVDDERQVEDGKISSFEDLGQEVAEETAQPDNTAAQGASQPENDDDLPEKYRGKSAREIARMHQEAERLVGKQSSEVGELRRTVDDFIKTQLSTQKPTANQQADDEIDDVDFYVNPKEAVKKALDSHPAIRQAQQTSAELAKQRNLAQIASKHPDFKQIGASAGFQQWVQSSVVRQNLFNLANNQYDSIAADELLSLYKERASMASESKVIADEDRKRQMKTASTGVSKASGESASRKIYKRADIVKLMREQPDVYHANYADIMRAYDEGRVR
jgi:hypothetical protein